MMWAERVSSVILVVGSAYIPGGALGVGRRGVECILRSGEASAMRSVIGIRVFPWICVQAVFSPSAMFEE